MDSYMDSYDEESLGRGSLWCAEKEKGLYVIESVSIIEEKAKELKRKGYLIDTSQTAVRIRLPPKLWLEGEEEKDKYVSELGKLIASELHDRLGIDAYASIHVQEALQDAHAHIIVLPSVIDEAKKIAREVSVEFAQKYEELARERGIGREWEMEERVERFGDALASVDRAIEKARAILVEEASPISAAAEEAMRKAEEALAAFEQIQIHEKE